MSASDNLLDVLLDKWTNRDEVAAYYAAVLRYEPQADWPRLNRAILERYSTWSLKYIKRRARQLNARLSEPSP